LQAQKHPIRIGAVSYLNTVPLVWGMLHGPERTQVDLTFSLPSRCADNLRNDLIDIGLMPVAEIARQDLEIVPTVGISCRGAVRSILLISRAPWRSIRTLALDEGSRTSVELARIILRERFGVEPQTAPRQPELEPMLADFDAALIIGDPALRIDPLQLPYAHLDLGAEWLQLTNLPMVFAAWAGTAEAIRRDASSITSLSYEFGRSHLDEIIDQEYGRRGISRELAETYLRKHICFSLGKEELQGLEAFWELAHLRKAAFAIA
jgi:predicted solute-binding protein